MSVQIKTAGFKKGRWDKWNLFGEVSFLFHLAVEAT